MENDMAIRIPELGLQHAGFALIARLSAGNPWNADYAFKSDEDGSWTPGNVLILGELLGVMFVATEQPYEELRPWIEG